MLAGHSVAAAETAVGHGLGSDLGLYLYHGSVRSQRHQRKVLGSVMKVNPSVPRLTRLVARSMVLRRRLIQRRNPRRVPVLPIRLARRFLHYRCSRAAVVAFLNHQQNG